MTLTERLPGAYTWPATATARPEVPAHLSPTQGTATTPDTPDMVLPNVFTIPFRVNGPLDTGDTLQTIAGQWEGGTDCSWLLRRERTTGDLWFSWTPTGNTADSGFAGVAFTNIVLPTPVDEYGAVTITQDNGAGGCELTAWTSPDGITWTQGATAVGGTTMVIHNSILPVCVGAQQTTRELFNGRIYTVEMRHGADPTAPRIWRFDPGGHPGFGYTWRTDSRPWTITASLAITRAIPSTPAEVCPTAWEISHRRSEIVTQIILGRDDGNATPQRTYNDTLGQSMYGVENPYSLTDLVAQDTAQLDRIADRLWRTRGKYTAPRIVAVTVDAATSTAARDLLTLLSVFEPSRYRCRHRQPRGTIFDRTYFATGVTHHMSPDGWTARIALDLASPWIADGGRFDQSDFNSATWG